MADDVDYDAIVIGSGFGGSVAALRLAEKGYRVAVLEQGRRVAPADMEAAARGPHRLLWAPGLGLRGYFWQRFLRHVCIVGGAGLGGGSIVWGAVLLEPGEAFYADPSWRDLGVDWRAELAPHYATAARMLGRATTPRLSTMDTWLRATAAALGAEESFGPTPVAIHFGRQPGETEPDPYFAGQGPARMACKHCGECLGGCPHGAKNSLDQNYLYLAERAGAALLTERRVVALAPRPGGGYVVESRHPWKRRQRYPALRARRVVLAAGVLGTLELLFRCRDELRTLPAISPLLGRVVRTNSEAIVAALAPDRDLDLTDGVAISSHFWANPRTHITQNRFPRAYEFMKWQTGPLVDGAVRWRRAARTVAAFLARPVRSTPSWRVRDWHKRVSVLTVMQDLDNRVQLRWRRGPLGGLASAPAPEGPLPGYIPEANEAARAFARAAGGEPHNTLPESLLGLSVTAHILGGCHMGSGPEDGVIDVHHEVFGHPGLFVADGAAVSANVGVNPSLTITALAERCFDHWPRA